MSNIPPGNAEPAVNNWKNTIAITGAGSGFGAALARRYAQQGWRVAVTDIDEARAQTTLSELDSGTSGSFAMRVDTTSQQHWQELEQDIQQRWGGLQVLINNAGVATSGNIEDSSMEDWQWVLDIDLMGVVRGCHQFAKMFKQQNAGHIVNVSSFAGLAGLPFVSSYGVAKAGVIALSEALRAEMAPYNVGVTVACPAFVKTNLLDSFRTTEVDAKDRVTRWMETSGVSAEEVAEAIAKAIDKKQFMLLTHKQTRKAWLLKRWMPERYYKHIGKHSGR